MELWISILEVIYLSIRVIWVGCTGYKFLFGDKKDLSTFWYGILFIALLLWGEKIMIYTEEMKRQINAAGFRVIEFKRFVKKFCKVLDSLVDLLKRMVRWVAKEATKIFSNFAAVIQKVRKMLPKQRYKFCRKLGIENYQCFFRRRNVYRARSCC